jgi:hypothetical protein
MQHQNWNFGGEGLLIALYRLGQNIERIKVCILRIQIVWIF